MLFDGQLVNLTAEQTISSGSVVCDKISCTPDRPSVGSGLSLLQEKRPNAASGASIAGVEKNHPLFSCHGGDM